MYADVGVLLGVKGRTIYFRRNATASKLNELTNATRALLKIEAPDISLFCGVTPYADNCWKVLFGWNVGPGECAELSYNLTDYDLILSPADFAKNAMAYAISRKQNDHN